MSLECKLKQWHNPDDPPSKEVFLPIFKTILIPIDHSDYSVKALGVAAGLALRFESAVHVVHAAETVGWADAMGGSPPPSDSEPGMRREDLVLLESARRQLGEAGVEAQSHLLESTSSIDKRILAAADELQAELMVIGAGGSFGVSRFLQGSTFHNILRRARCYVLVVR